MLGDHAVEPVVFMVSHGARTDRIFVRKTTPRVHVIPPLGGCAHTATSAAASAGVWSYRRSFLDHSLAEPGFDDEPILLRIVTPDVSDLSHRSAIAHTRKMDDKADGQGDRFPSAPMR